MPWDHGTEDKDLLSRDVYEALWQLKAFLSLIAPLKATRCHIPTAYEGRASRLHSI